MRACRNGSLVRQHADRGSVDKQLGADKIGRRHLEPADVRERLKRRPQRYAASSLGVDRRDERREAFFDETYLVRASRNMDRADERQLTAPPAIDDHRGARVGDHLERAELGAQPIHLRSDPRQLIGPQLVATRREQLRVKLERQIAAAYGCVADRQVQGVGDAHDERARLEIAPDRLLALTRLAQALRLAKELLGLLFIGCAAVVMMTQPMTPRADAIVLASQRFNAVASPSRLRAASPAA